MSKLQTAGLVGGGVAAILAVIAAVFSISWGVIHGVLELGQYAFASQGWTWEPVWSQTIFITLAFNMLHSTITVRKSD